MIICPFKIRSDAETALLISKLCFQDEYVLKQVVIFRKKRSMRECVSISFDNLIDINSLVSIIVVILLITDRIY